MYRHAATLALLTVLMASPPPLSAQDTDDAALREVGYPEGGAQLGQGWRSRSIQPAERVCVVFEQMAVNPGQDKEVSMKRVSDQTTFSYQIGVSAEETVKGIGDLPSESGKFGFSASLDFDAERSRWSVRAKVDGGSIYTGIPASGALTLTPAATEILRTRGLDAFYDACGDGYIHTILSGAELSAVITTSVVRADGSSTLEESTEFDGSVASFSDHIEEHVTAGHEHQELDVRSYETGGNQSDPTADCGDADDPQMCKLEAQVSALSDRAGSAPYRYSLLVQSYGDLIRDALSDPRFAFSETPYSRVAREWGKWNALAQTIQEVIDTPDEYLLARYVSLDSVDAMQEEVQKRLAAVTTVAQACLNDVTRCEDLSPRSDLPFLVRLPLPVTAAYPEAAFVGADAYRGDGTDDRTLRERIRERWVRPINSVRCATVRDDGSYCFLNREVLEALNGVTVDGTTLFYEIRAGDPENEICLTVASDGSARAMAFECRGDHRQTQLFTYDPSTKLVRVMSSIRPAWQERWTWRTFPDDQTVCLNVWQRRKSAGTHVIGWPCEQEENMRFEFRPTGDDSAHIVDLNSSLCLTVSGDDDPPQVELASCRRATTWSFHNRTAVPAPPTATAGEGG